jgi:peptide/nickel transport system permease protein
MWRTILKRIAYGIFWIWVISVLAFFLSRHVPGDVIHDYLSAEPQAVTISQSPAAERVLYQQVAAKRGLDLPAFYFSIRKGIYPDSLSRILPFDERHAVRNWIDQTHDSDNALRLHQTLRHALTHYCGQSTNRALCTTIDNALREPALDKVQSQLETAANRGDSVATVAVYESLLLIEAMQQPARIATSAYFPSVAWHGTNNQYHQWITGLVAQRPMTSLTDGRNAWIKINEALRWTLIINLIAFVLTLLIGCAIGIWSSLRDRTTAERIVNTLLFAAFAIPSFWLATLCILFFSSGAWLSILPSGGLGPYHRATTMLEAWGIVARHLVLPVLCLTIGSIAYISRQMKQSMLHELMSPYVKAMRAQGVSERVIVRRHVVRNALFPIITIMGQSLPALISGSLVIEVIFSIPGMGRLLFTSILARDWPVVFPVLMLSAAVTVMAYILMDIVYAWIDPRVKSIG